MEASTERLWSTVFGTSFKLSGTAKRSALSTSLTLRRYAHGEGNLDYLFTAAARDRNHGSTPPRKFDRSEEHTSELQSLMRISYAVFCLKNNTTTKVLSRAEIRR